MYAKKRIFSLLLAAVMLLALLPSGVLAEDVQATPLTLDQKTTAVITEEGQGAFFSFVPEETGYYIFRSAAEKDTRAVLYSGDMEHLDEDDDGSPDANFLLNYELEAGKTYYYEARFYDDEATGAFPVRLYRNPFKTVTDAKVTAYQNMGGEWHWLQDGAQWNSYFDYYHTAFEDLRYRVTLTDGSSLEATTPIFPYNGEEYEVFYESNLDPATWEIGKTYSGVLDLLNVSGDLEITVARFPAKSLSLEPVSIAEYNYATRYYWDPQTGTSTPYKYYHWEDLLTGTITMEDGTVCEVEEGFFYYQDVEYSLAPKTRQGPDNEWSLGNTYDATVTCGPLEVTVPVTVVDSSYEPDDPEKTELPDLAQTTPLTPDEMLYAQISEAGGSAWLTYTPTNDGLYILASYTDLDPWVELYDEDGQYLDGDDDGGANTNFCLVQTLEAGKTYYFQVRFWEDSDTGTVPLSLLHCPVKDLQLDPITIVEFTNGSSDEWWNPQTEAWEDFFLYRYEDRLSGTVTFEDNSTATITDGEFAYNDFSIGIPCEDAQGVSTIWTAGNTYQATTTLGKATATVAVTIEKSPVVKIDVQPITLHGDVDAHYDNYEEAVYYDWFEKAVVTVTFNDGTSYTAEPGQDYVVYKGEDYGIDTSDEQSAEQQWKPGNTYTVAVTVMNVTGTASVTIGPNLIKKVEPIAVSVAEGIDGSWYGEDEIDYFRYNWDEKIDNLTVTLADNTVFTCDIYELEERLGADVYWFCADTQSDTHPWTVGNTYDAALLLGSHKVPVKVTVTESPIKSVDFEPIILPKQSEAYYDWSAHLLYTVNFRDGTKRIGDGNGIQYEGLYYWPEPEDTQEDTPWTVGDYTGTIHLLGKTYTVPISIREEKTSGDYSYVVYNNKAYLSDSRTGKETLTLPTSLGGYSVAGVLCVGEDLSTLKQLTVPNAIAHLDPLAFCPPSEDLIPLEKLTLGSGVKLFNSNMMAWAEVKEVSVNSDNANYYSTDGVVYNKAKTKLVFYPWMKSDSHTIPNTVTDINELLENQASIANLKVTLGTGTKDLFTQEGDVVYSKDKTALIFCNSTLSGSFTVPNTVAEMAQGAFANTAVTSVTLHSGIRDLPPYAFLHCDALTKVENLGGLEELGLAAFYGCSSLKHFEIPQGILYIDNSTFAFSGLTSIVIPVSVLYIYGSAFRKCPLTDVFYGGDETNWRSIEISDSGNEALLNANIHFAGDALPGDVDGDARKNTDDAVYLLLHVMFGTEDYPVPAGINLDFDGNGTVSTDDAVYLLLHVMFGAEDYPI